MPLTGRLAAALLLALACGCAKPNVIVIVVDTLRADRLGAYGSTRGLTPFLDDLARRGVVFRNTYATCSWTSPSVASLFTSRYPAQHLVGSYDSALADDETTLAETLTGARYHAEGYVANFRLKRELGFGQGFDVWYTFVRKREYRGHSLQHRLLSELPRSWNRKAWHRLLPRPLFLYLHYMEPHTPYEPRRATRARLGIPAFPDRKRAQRRLVAGDWSALTPTQVDELRQLYDGEVAEVDRVLRRLFAALTRQGILQHAVVVVTADHGEQFMEHGAMGHGTDLYNETLRVPLLLLGDGIPAGLVVEDNVSLVDVAPTVLALVGVAPPPGFEGRSLVPFLRGTHLPPADVIAHLPRAGELHTERHRRALLRGSLKLLEGSDPAHREIYDLGPDPGEQHPDPPALAGRLAELARALAARDTELAGRAQHTARRVPVDDDTRTRLRALGYAN